MSEWKQILIENLLFAADIGLICWFLRLYKNKYTTADQIKVTIINICLIFYQLRIIFILILYLRQRVNFLKLKFY